jgi:hypothetical protein
MQLPQPIAPMFLAHDGDIIQTGPDELANDIHRSMPVIVL